MLREGNTAIRAKLIFYDLGCRRRFEDTLLFLPHRLQTPLNLLQVPPQMIRYKLLNNPLQRLLPIPDMLAYQLQITIPQPTQNLIQPRITPWQSRLNLL